LRSYIESLTPILEPAEKIWYYAGGGQTMYYIVTSKRILCYRPSIFGESVEKPLWICKLKDIERMKISIPFFYSIFLGFFKDLILFLKEGGKQKIQFLPKVDIEGISKLIESRMAGVER
jgi:hypothetical protein